MSGRFEGKVAFITGAARGQGRSHAVRFAEEGADIIAFDLCDQLDSVEYPMSRPEDLDETVNLVEKTGRRIVAAQGDVRSTEALQNVVADGVAQFGRLDFVFPNAGILSAVNHSAMGIDGFDDSVSTMLNGVYYTIEAALPALLAHEDGGAIVITSSIAGLRSLASTFSLRSHGMAGYIAAKHGVVGLMRYYCTSLAARNIRVNTVHPTAVATPMIENEEVGQFFVTHPEAAVAFQNLLPVGTVESIDITEAFVYLCSGAGRYITGTELKVDAGWTNR